MQHLQFETWYLVCIPIVVISFELVYFKHKLRFCLSFALSLFAFLFEKQRNSICSTWCMYLFRTFNRDNSNVPSIDIVWTYAATIQNNIPIQSFLPFLFVAHSSSSFVQTILRLTNNRQLILHLMCFLLNDIDFVF